MEIIDLSQSLEEVEFDTDPKIDFIDHRKGANLLGLLSILDKSIIKTIKNLFLFILRIRKIDYRDFPEGLGLAWERFNGDSHTGTHMDAPYHFGPESAREKSKTIDKIPLKWCFSDGVVLDCSNGPEQIGETEVKIALDKIDYRLKPYDIVLIHTGASYLWKSKNYTDAHKSISAEAIRWISAQGVKIIGIDAFTIDPPFKKMFYEYFKSRDNASLWPGHIIGREIEYCHIENLTNLEALLERPFGFKVSCFPIKLYKGSAGWTRVVAIY